MLPCEHAMKQCSSIVPWALQQAGVRPQLRQERRWPQSDWGWLLYPCPPFVLGCWCCHLQCSVDVSRPNHDVCMQRSCHNMAYHALPLKARTQVLTIIKSRRQEKSQSTLFGKSTYYPDIALPPAPAPPSVGHTFRLVSHNAIPSLQAQHSHSLALIVLLSSTSGVCSSMQHVYRPPYLGLLLGTAASVLTARSIYF